MVRQAYIPTMPVIPKDVAIAIFREGLQHGVESACTELEGQTIEVNENGYCGGFEVSFSKEIDLDFELDLDWMRGKVGNYSEEFVVDALSTLCSDKEFECRIHAEIGKRKMTKKKITQALDDACGVRRKAAALLGITERHLYRLLKKTQPQMTDEYMKEQWAKIEARLKRFEETASPQDKLFLDCMVRDWEAKMRLKLKIEDQK